MRPLDRTILVILAAGVWALAAAELAGPPPAQSQVILHPAPPPTVPPPPVLPRSLTDPLMQPPAPQTPRDQVQVPQPQTDGPVRDVPIPVPTAVARIREAFAGCRVVGEVVRNRIDAEVVCP